MTTRRDDPDLLLRQGYAVVPYQRPFKVRRSDLVDVPPQPFADTAFAAAIRRLFDGMRFAGMRPKVGAPASARNGDFRASMRWVEEHDAEHAGRWVALLGGEPLAEGEDLEALRQSIAGHADRRHVLVVRCGWLTGADPTAEPSP